MKHFIKIFPLFIAVLLWCCQERTTPKLFRLIKPSQSGIDFENNLEMSDSFSILNYMYFFNGGGVAIGDINNDDLPDIYFTGNQVSSKLYVNEGSLRFSDVTKSAKVATTRWTSGATMVDINHDGWLDIYVCVTGSPDPDQRKNLLFINNGDLTFSEQAEKYGLADTSYSTQAAFLDFDQDGDLDLYLLNHNHQFRGTNNPVPKKDNGQSPNTDRLFNNETDEEGKIFFKNVSKKAGILIEGFGLGVAVADLNGDDWPDIYISNDFMSNDILYLNNQDGTFSNEISNLIAHQSHNGMGNDVADINNDALPDIFVADMLPATHERRQLMAMNTSEDLFNAGLEMGYEPQYTRNTLQLNNGKIKGEQLPFSEIGQMATVHATDWSWSPLFADLDNDGWKDLTITNGYYRDITDLDFITYRSQRTSFRTQAAIDSLYLQLIQHLPAVKIPNFTFRNNRNLLFTDMSETWGLDQRSLSNGSAVADLDNDGDLDLVINNLDDPAFIYENQLRNDEGHFLQVKLRGDEKNPHGIGAKIFLYTNDHIQYAENQLTHGFQSSLNSVVHFGISGTSIDSLIVCWSSSKYSKIINPKIDERISIYFPTTMTETDSIVVQRSPQTIFANKTNELLLNIRHRENEFQEFKKYPSQTFMYSRGGPAAAQGDLNGDGLADLFIGGAAGAQATICYQQKDGTFMPQPFSQDSVFEDVAALIFDADKDGDNDLLVVSGGSEYAEGLSKYQHRLYKNSRGILRRSQEALPISDVSGSCVSAVDFDQDGDLDLFIGSRISIDRYPQSPPSFLWENVGGNFRDVTETWAKDLASAGMVTAAEWCDYNNDGEMDLVVVGEWTPIIFFRNTGRKLVRDTIIIEGGEYTDGWWRSIVSADFDRDGDTDFVVGNIGLNTSLFFDQTYPATLFFGNSELGRTGSILSYFQRSEAGGLSDYPQSSRDELIDLFPGMEKKFTSYSAFAQSTTKEVLPDYVNKSMKAYQRASIYLENMGGKTFKIIALPLQAQFSSINDMIIGDFDQDSFPDLLTVGNDFEARVEIGRFDASFGSLLLGGPNGRFSPVSSNNSGWLAHGNTRHIIRVDVAGTRTFVVIRNNSAHTAYQIER
jgi:hypothetical protein